MERSWDIIQIESQLKNSRQNKEKFGHNEDKLPNSECRGNFRCSFKKLKHFTNIISGIYNTGYSKYNKLTFFYSYSLFSSEISIFHKQYPKYFNVNSLMCFNPLSCLSYILCETSPNFIVLFLLCLSISLSIFYFTFTIDCSC